MKRKITTLFFRYSNYRNKTCCFIALSFLMILGTAINAQNVNWTSGYPKIDSQPIVTLEDDRTLQIRFTPLAGNINNAIIEAQLPANVDYVSAMSPTAGITCTASASGGLVTITVTSNGNKLLQNAEVEFYVKFNAKCASAGAANFDVKVKSGATLVTDGQKSLTANIVVPSLALTSSDGTINYLNQTDLNNITYVLKTNTADKASSAKVTFTTDLTSTLSDFKLNGAAFTPAFTSGTNKVYTFEFTPAVLGSKIDNTNSKVITFKGGSTQCGSHVITANVQYPYNSNCASATGSMVTMAFGSLPVPEMTHINTTYVNGSDAAIANSAINMDGSTATNVKTVFRNDGGSDAMEIAMEARHYGQWAYIDINDIYVQVQGNAKRKVTLGEIKINASRTNNSNYVYYSSGFGKPNSITIQIQEAVPVGKTVTYWIPTINGKIYNNGTNNVFHDYGINTINGFVTNVTSVKSPCGDAGVTTTVANRIAYMNAPHYRQLPASKTFKSNQTRIQTIYVAPGYYNTGTSTFVEFHIQHPGWLTISSVAMTPYMDGTGTPVGLTTTESSSTKTAVRINGSATSGGAYLHITYQADPCGGTNTTDTIHYWANQIWGSNTLEKISQVFQEVTHECEVDGITLDEFKVIRTTRGLTDNAAPDRVPDDGSTASESDIRHDAYVDGDEGYFYWEGTIKDANLKVIDIPVKTTGFSLASSGTRNVLLIGGNSVIPAGGTISYTYTNDNSGYFRIQYSSPLANGTNVQIKVPFRLRAGTNNYNNIETEFRAGSSTSALRGKDKSSAPMGLYNLDRLNWWSHDGRNEVFPNNTVKNISLGYVDIFHSGRFVTPWFSKEVRFHEYLEKLEWNLPKGYKLNPSVTFTATATSNALSASLNEDGSSTTLQKIHNVGTLYDLTYNGSGTVAPGKFQLPDDFWRLNLSGGMQATRAAKIGNSTMTRIATWRKPGGGATTSLLTVTLIYNGEGTLLEIAPKTITAYGPTVKNPVLTITNPNSYTMQDVYFYLDGNIKNVILKDADGGLTYNGQGIDKRWVKIPNLVSGGSKSYEMTYDYNGKSTCTNDTIVVYTASGFNAAWSPNTSIALDLTDDLHVGYSDEFIIKTAPATVSGSITSSKDTIPHESAGDYKIKASFNTLNSNGALKNPEMIFTVPVGQYYVSGSAQIEFPVGSFTNVPPAMNADLVAAFGPGTETVDRTYTLKLADANGGDILIPGNLDPTATINDFTASIVLTMKASCDTEILGSLQYKGEISGTSACNAAATGNGTKIVSPVIYPDVSYNYLFDDITTTTTSGVRAFNEIQTQDTILLTVKKITGTVNNMIPTDSIEILMPEELDLDGNSIYYEGTGSMSAITGTSDVIGDNTITSGVRTLQFPMPIAAYNGATNKGVGDNVTYKIPVKYTPNGQSRAANPVDSIISDIYSQAIFGTCPPVKVSVGHGKDSVALMTADSIPYIVYVADTAELKITSNGFGGSWYSDQTSPIVLSTDNPWLHTPTDTFALGDTTYYFSSIVDGHDYGRLPYPLKIYIHPWFIQNLDTFNYVCEEEDSLFIRAGGMDLKYQWYHNLTTPITGATDTFYVASVDGKYHVLVTDSVGETISSDTMNFFFNEVPVFTENLPDKVKECDKWGYNLKIETTGHHLLYQWYRNGVKIPGANEDSYYALSNDSSAYFRVSVKTLCGDSMMSNQCFVDFCDGKYPVNINREVRLIAPETIETDPKAGIHQVQSQTDFVFMINVKDGYSLEYIKITTDDPIWTNEGGIVKKMISDNKMQVSIRTITKPLIVTVSGISPVSNEEMDNDLSKAWAHNGKIYIKATEDETIYVFTTMGHLYMKEKVKEGISSFNAEPGVYFIKFNSGYSGKVFVK